MDNNFKNELIDKFIALVESERGIPAKLAKSINKPNSYISSVTTKRNPVNANHLRAVGLVFGPEKVCELLSIGNIESGIAKLVDQRTKPDDIVVQFPKVVEDHIDIVKQFEDHDAAMEINQDLLYIEKESKDAFKEVMNIVKGVKIGISAKGKSDRRKKSMPFSPDRRKKVS